MKEKKPSGRSKKEVSGSLSHGQGSAGHKGPQVHFILAHGALLSFLMVTAATIKKDRRLDH